MKRAACVLMLSALGALGIGPAGAATGNPTHTKPSALAPRHHGGSHVYGAPIQQPIFRSRPKPKSAQSGTQQGPQPQH
jgi:hypothetical protein